MLPSRLSIRPVLRVAAALVLLTAAGCGSAPGLTAPSTTNSLLETDLVIGTGPSASVGHVLTVDFTGWVYDSTKPDNKGTQFQTTIGVAPITFTLGDGTLLPGFDQGCNGMKAGGVRRLTVPPSLAYGVTGSGTLVPPNATLIFEVTLDTLQ